MAYLVLIRHGLSTYNQKGLWTGWDNPPLTQKGKQEALQAAEALMDIKFDFAFCSTFLRTKETLKIVLTHLSQENIPVVYAKSLNERNYGIYTGKNKWEVQKTLGDKEFKELRRSWDYKIPKGESLKQVYEREIPYFKEKIAPQISAEKNILIVSSGNALRAIVKYLENIPNDKISEFEIGTGEVLVYKLNKGQIIQKEVRHSNSAKV